MLLRYRGIQSACYHSILFVMLVRNTRIVIFLIAQSCEQVRTLQKRGFDHQRGILSLAQVYLYKKIIGLAKVNLKT